MRSLAACSATGVHSYSSGALYGLLWGVIWWVLGGLILMPLLLGMPAFAPLQMEPMRPVTIGSLVGHLLYGLVLGLVYVRLSHPVPMADMRPLAR